MRILGRRISWIKEDSKFHRFLGLDYPNAERVVKAYGEGRLSATEWQTLQQAFASDRIPPQSTSLGGQIGVHGIGAGDPELHQAFNWTNGCIALTNEQLDQLMQWVRIGTRVRIR